MSERMTITHYREVTEIGRYEAEVDPQHYIGWCKEADYEASELWVLQEYLLEGHGDSEYKEPVDECGSEFRDFEDADYANKLVTAARSDGHMRSAIELRTIAVDELQTHIWPGRDMSMIAQEYDLTPAEQRRVYLLLQGARIVLPTAR